jgi:hypothetical protein
MATSDAVAREAAWLQTSGDGPPALLVAAGGPFEVVQAYWPGAKFAQRKSGVYVQRRRTLMPRFGGRRIMPGYVFVLKVCWPVKSTAAGFPETEQQNLDSAVDLLLQRIDGLPGDKTHGGRFLSAGEAPQGQYPEVEYQDAEITLAQGNWLRATVTYPADDQELLG